ncbi:pilus assembly protein [Phytoactinopolyspora alkaliphila]|uniref:Pilus assembly protein n=1 Tax=Phytoactinopolyspora alkaliphila TaxID=1783498 RepID=A0A6N9YMZ5_9ACTN|nr:TadE/TadG family type IV pilus assembly protein [Phytoactinopolyspora alkaliphila]NED96315.1 pilus assembly protein [Phytoactinopolyspora alkaliphila]
MAIEVVLLVPILVAVMLLVIGFGRYADRQGDVQSAAREAARAASYERDIGSAQAAAQQAANRALPGGLTCQGVDLGGSNFTAGGSVTVRVSCQVSFAELAFAGFPGSATMTGQSVAPLDQWRRTS